MKKGLIVLCIISIIALMCGCTNDTDGRGAHFIDGTVTYCDLEGIAQVLDLKAISLGCDILVNSSYYFDDENGEQKLCCLDLSDDGIEYNVRIVKGSVLGDISAVRLNEKIDSSIYDSEDENIAPSVYIESDSEHTKATAVWNDYTMSVTSEKIGNNIMYDEVIKMSKIIAVDNIK